MTRHETAILSFKVLSIYALIRVIDGLYPFLFYVVHGSGQNLEDVLNALVSSVPTLLMALCAALLWFGSSYLAKSIFKYAALNDDSTISLTDIHKVAFSVVGLFTLATSLPDAVEVAVVLMTKSTVQSDITAIAHGVVSLLFKVFLGLWLLFGSHRFINFLNHRNNK